MLTIKPSVTSNHDESGIILSNKLLTDLEVLNLTRELQRADTKAKVIDLSFNNLKDRSGVYIGNLLAQGYDLKTLKLTGCCIEKDGVQRILETLNNSSKLRSLDIGQVSDIGLSILAKYVPRSEKLKYLAFQEFSEGCWTENAKRNAIDALYQSQSLLDVEITCLGHQDFIEEIQAICDRNKKAHAQRKEEKLCAQRQDPKLFAEEIQKFIEGSAQNLPVRVYLENSLGTILNDTLYELAKFRQKESDPSQNTASKNIKWIIRHIIDNYFPNK
ncbi:unnamed protein product [Blepharisma stoltei]|uniref:Uncharacterized protein n=1 Tax=Blepharisma stoltei TaxID=1481888 RepID=A0AAU9KBT0_9CILI|nr:unnamed protein product [Blepharisma stoltei]